MVFLACAVLLSGCTLTAAPSADPTPSPAATFPSESLSGRGTADGSAEVPVTIPEGARSVVVDFGCTGAENFFSIEFGDSMADGSAPLTGHCGGVQPLALAVDADSGPLRVFVPDGVRWVARVTFSAEEFAGDPAVAAECAAYSPIFSLLSNADLGFSHYDDLDEAEWRARATEGSTRLVDLGASSETMLAELFTDFGANVGDPTREVGKALDGSHDISALIARICDANQSPIVIMADYGG